MESEIHIELSKNNEKPQQPVARSLAQTKEAQSVALVER